MTRFTYRCADCLERFDEDTDPPTRVLNSSGGLDKVCPECYSYSDTDHKADYEDFVTDWDKMNLKPEDTAIKS